jgi:pyruvate/2-oxoglutarate dehydrogenase complex dihydrolipoamide acyltransferase (E2) component
MSLIEIKVPDIGDFSEVAVIELLVKPGDTIKAEQSLITVESDKASMEIPSSHAGVVKELKVKLGDKVAEGSVVVLLEASGAACGGPGSPRSPCFGTKTACLPAPSGSQGCYQCLNHLPPPSQPPSAARRTWSATCWCSAAALAATRRRSARRTWA